MQSNAAALSELMIAERASLLRRLERVTGNQPDAEEVAQSLWFRIQRVADEPPIQHMRAYLFRLALNLALDHRRAAVRRIDVHAEVEALLSGTDDAPGPDRIVDSLVTLRRVRDAAEALGEPTRTIFRLNRFEGLTYKAIAARLGVSTTTVENHMRRALDRLAEARDAGA